VCKVDGNEWLHKLSETQHRLNSWDNIARQHSQFFSLLGFEAKICPSFFPYLMNPYTPAEERHLDTSCNLYSSKVKQAKQTSKKRSVPLLLSGGQKVLLSMVNINLLNTSRKLEPRRVWPFYIQHINRKWNNYALDLSMDSLLSLIHNTSTSARSNLTLKTIRLTFQVVTGSILVKKRKEDRKSNEYTNFVLLFV